MTCTIEGCTKLAACRGWCDMHYTRWKRHKDTSVVLKPILRLPVNERFWAKVDKNGPIPEHRPDLGPCWIWLGYLDRYGYGQFALTHNKSVGAHRYSYKQAFGPIPRGLQPDHLCRTRACVNPHHMELVTPQVNTLRGISFSAINAAATHCIHGHPFDLFNTYITKTGARSCRTCRTRWDRESRQRVKKRLAA